MNSLLDRVEADKAECGESFQEAASAEAVARLRIALQEAFGARLPDDYAAFLQRTNGLDYNGLVLYGATQDEKAPGPGGFWQGLVATNRLWRTGEGRDGCLILGETEMDLLLVDLDGSHPRLHEKISDDLIETFGSVEEAVVACLRQRL